VLKFRQNRFEHYGKIKATTFPSAEKWETLPSFTSFSKAFNKYTIE
jgi:hypothetical protein